MEDSDGLRFDECIDYTEGRASTIWRYQGSSMPGNDGYDRLFTSPNPSSPGCWHVRCEKGVSNRYVGTRPCRFFCFLTRGSLSLF
jgi:hypothetical protein